MLTDILIFYYIFSILFMIGYIDTKHDSLWLKIVFYIGLFIISPIMFPINIGYYVRKNS